MWGLMFLIVILFQTVDPKGRSDSLSRATTAEPALSLSKCRLPKEGISKKTSKI